MASFSATSAGVEGFRIIKSHPGTIAVWAGVNILITVLVLGLMFGILGGSVFADLQALEAASASESPDFSQIWPMFRALGGVILLILPVAIVAGAMLQAAVNRVVLRPDEKSPGFLRLGMDEVRVFLVQFILWLLAVVLIGLLAVGLGALGQISGWLVFFGVLGAIVLVVFLAVRLSLAIPQTFATRRLNLFGSFGLTKGNFWGIFGAYALAVACYLVIAIAVAIVFGVIAAVIGGVMAATAMSGGEVNPSALGPMMGAFGAAQIVNLLLQAVLGAVALAIFGGPPAAIYKALSGETAAEVF